MQYESQSQEFPHSMMLLSEVKSRSTTQPFASSRYEKVRPSKRPQHFEFELHSFEHLQGVTSLICCAERVTDFIGSDVVEELGNFKIQAVFNTD